MKVFYRILFCMLILVSSAFAETHSTAKITGTGDCTTLRLPAPYNMSTSAGTFNGVVNGANAKFYCIDINHSLALNENYTDKQSTSSNVTYILNNYYPYRPLPYSGSLIAAKEAAAVQAAIWYFTDALDVNGLNVTDVKNRTLAIIADSKANSGAIQPFKTLLIRVPAQSFNIGSVIKFYAEAYNEVGAPIPNANITLEVNEGSLSSYSVTTDAAGVSEPVYLTAGPNNSTTITAKASVTIPHGTEYHHIASPDTKQKLVIATPVTAVKTITDCVNWYNSVSLALEKTSKTVIINDGDKIEYELKVTNTGTVNATGVKVNDLLPGILKLETADGEYEGGTGIWNVGELNAGESKTLKVVTKANYSSAGAETFDLGVASDYNLFVLNDLYQPSSDTEGKIAVGNDAVLSNYSVGDKLPAGSDDVIIVGRKLTYKSGRVYNGNVVFGSFIDTTHWNLADGSIRQDSVINFKNAALYLNNLSDQIASLQTTGTDTVDYSHLILTGTNASLNKFNISAEEIKKCNDITINIPENSVALVNVSGDSVTISGGFSVVGATNENVLLNFYEAKYLKISNIDVRASILAPRADLDFPSGLISGQVIVYNMKGSGQFNNVKFKGRITLDIAITNVAEIISVDQPMASAICVPISKKQITRTLGSALGVNSEKGNLPVEYKLSQNYPNPFNPSTRINFSVIQPGNYILRVFNSLGQLVNTLVNGYLNEGNFSISFNAGNLSSGVYFYELSGRNVKLVQKMVLSK